MSAVAEEVEIGDSGSKVSLESDLQILMGNGGGHATWRISGQAGKDLRAVIDENYGNGDGNVVPSEAKAYTSALDNYLTNSAIVYHGGKLQAFSLLDRNRGVEDNTEFLVTQVNDSGTVEIRFLIEATINTRNTDYKLNDDVLVTALFENLRTGYDNDTYRYVGQVEIVHNNYIVGMCSFSDFDTDYGTVWRFRGPIWEIYRYSVTYEGGTMGVKKDMAQFDTFNFIQSPLELFILVMVLGFLTLHFPKRMARNYRRRRVKGLHRGAMGLVVLNIVLYLLGVDGLVIWFLAPLMLIVVLVLSYKIYGQGWKGLAEPMSESEKMELDRKEGIVRPESYDKIRSKRRRKRSSRAPRPRPPEDRPLEEELDGYYEDEYVDEYEDEYVDEYEDEYVDEYEDEYDDHGGRPARHREEEPAPSPRRPRRDRDGRTRRKSPPRERTRSSGSGPPTAAKGETGENPQRRRRKGSPSRSPPKEKTGRGSKDGSGVEQKKIKCVQCKEVFVAEIRERPSSVECPDCGKKGIIR